MPVVAGQYLYYKQWYSEDSKHDEQDIFSQINYHCNILRLPIEFSIYEIYNRFTNIFMKIYQYRVFVTLDQYRSYRINWLAQFYVTYIVPLASYFCNSVSKRSTRKWWSTPYFTRTMSCRSSEWNITIFNLLENSYFEHSVWVVRLITITRLFFCFMTITNYDSESNRVLPYNPYNWQRKLYFHFILIFYWVKLVYLVATLVIETVGKVSFISV